MPPGARHTSGPDRDARNLEIRCEIEGVMPLTVGIQVRKPALLSVGTWQPAEKMVEAAVLHDDDDYMLDPASFRIWHARF